MIRINIKLARREKIVVSAGACFVGFFVLLYVVIFPFFSSRAKLRRGIEGNQEQLKEVMHLSAEYQALQKNSGGMRKAITGRKKDFTLFSLLEKLAGQAGVKDRIKYMRPSRSQGKGRYEISTVEMQLEGITMQQLFDYLYRIEAPKNIVRIKRISIKKHKEKSGYVDATLRVLTFETV
ncbi:MAG: type II secretion system protein M [Desulfobacterales bacterium]|nr:type II secretion system protein M [Desulfobacterales bacterium]